MIESESYATEDGPDEANVVNTTECVGSSIPKNSSWSTCERHEERFFRSYDAYARYHAGDKTDQFMGNEDAIALRCRAHP